METNINLSVTSEELGNFQFEINATKIGKKYLVNLPEPLFGCCVMFADSMVSAVRSVIGVDKFNKIGFSMNSTFQCLGNSYFALRQGCYSVLVRPLSKFSIEVVTNTDGEPFRFEDGKNYIDFIATKYQTSNESLILVINQGIRNEPTIKVVDWRSLSTTEVQPIPFTEKQSE